MKQAHIVVGVLAIATCALGGLLGGWCWWRARPSVWFWRLLRAGQATVVVEAALGGVLVLLGHKPSKLHILYGVLPVVVSFFGEQLRAASAQMVLDARGLESAQAVGVLPEEEQRALVVSIVRREIAVMTITSLVIVVLLLRAAATAG